MSLYNLAQKVFNRVQNRQNNIIQQSMYLILIKGYKILEADQTNQISEINKIPKSVKELQNSCIIYKQISTKKHKRMDIIKIGTHKFLNSQNKMILADLGMNILTAILSYLSEEDLQALVQSIQFHNNLYPWKILMDMCRIRISMKAGLNKVDRGYYFNIYDSNCYKLQQQNRISNIVNTNQLQTFCNFPIKLKKLVQKCSQFVNSDLKQEFAAKLQEFFVDPILPLPKLSRETTANLTNSTLQSHVLSINDPSFYLSYSSILSSPFSQIEEQQSSQEQNIFKSVLKSSGKFIQMINSGYQISHINYEDQLIEGNNMHNMVCHILAITDLYIQNVEAYLQFIADPFQLLLQLATRYTQFVNSVIAVQENLGFMFKIYRQIYQEIYESKIQYSFWKMAMKKWAQKMEKNHNTTTRTFIQVLYNLVHNQSQSEYFNLKTMSSNDIFESKMDLINRMHLFSMHDSNMSKNASKLYEKFMQNEDQIKMLLKIYEQYLVDIDIKENEVFYSQFSGKRFGGEFYNLQENLVSQEIQFIEKLKTANFSENQIISLKEYMQIRINKFEKFIKPSTLSLIMNLYNREQLQVKSQNIQLKDIQILRYVQYLERSSKRKFDMNNEENEKQMTQSTQSSNDSNNFDIENYDSENEMEIQSIEEIMDIQTF